MLKQLDFETFQQRCTQGDRVPVYREFLADMDTPVSVLRQFIDDPNAFLLESVEGSEHWARYSFIGVNPYCIVQAFPDQLLIREADGSERREATQDGLRVLKKMLQRVKLAPSPELPPMVGGAIGFIAYDSVRSFEPTVPLEYAPDTPLMCFMLTDDMIMFDTVRHTIIISVCCTHSHFADPAQAYAQAQARIDEIYRRIRAPQRPLKQPAQGAMQPFKAEMSEAQFSDMVARAKQAIFDGECIQVVLSQRFTTPAPASALQLYRALRLINPSPYTFYLQFADRCLIGASPEVLAKLRGRRALVRPIAGTRPRGEDSKTDQALAEEMTHSEKECAEHIMLVDLGRNDIGRVARAGSVEVKELMYVERYSHVMHMVSQIEADLDDAYDAFDLLRATFPAGTLSGAPKIRAMQLIAELEHSPRGIYGGAVGYFSYNGNMDFAIVIRTMLLENGILSMRAGAGIVADSIARDEYRETLNKSRAAFRAAELAATLD